MEDLCTVRNEEFISYYCIVEKDVSQLKRKKKTSFKDMYKYCEETMSRYLKGMNMDAEHNNPILWQVWTACHVSCVTSQYIRW